MRQVTVPFLPTDASCSTGLSNRIQVSQTTATLLKAAGKEHWLEQRDDSVLAKGKGVLNTFWLVPKGQDSQEPVVEPMSNLSSSDNFPDDNSSEIAAKKHRLIDWVVELLIERLKLVVAKRSTRSKKGTIRNSSLKMHENDGREGCTVLDEVVEAIDLPKFDEKNVVQSSSKNVNIDQQVIRELHEFVSVIASTYRDNPFHNFEHACHVTLTVDKFLKRIVSPDLEIEQSTSHGAAMAQLHDYTHGITSDPLTLFAIVFSALIHDVDHRGISNTRLIEEEPTMAEHYKYQSIAEQNSVDLSWNLLMSKNFANLCACIFDNQQSELKRFRQVVINVVLATDIFDKNLNDLRKNRWEKAFNGAQVGDDGNGLKATIVIEHIIQASDVAHTMQHWHIYRKWNHRLFKELYDAYKRGRMTADPSTFWYKGELAFFDNYIIPLAKKLKDCNVFGVSSDECLNYALQNRAEWEARGQEILQEVLAQL